MDHEDTREIYYAQARRQGPKAASLNLPVKSPGNEVGKDSEWSDIKTIVNIL